MRDLLGVQALQAGRYRRRVGDDVLHEVRAHAGRVAQKQGLHGRRAQRKDLVAHILSVPAQVDQHLHPVRRDALRRLGRAQGVDVHEVLRCGRGGRPHRGAAVWVDGIAEHLHRGAVMLRHEVLHDAAHRVLPEVGRDVADAEAGPRTLPAPLVSLRQLQWGPGRRRHLRRLRTRDVQAEPGGDGGHAERVEGAGRHRQPLPQGALHSGRHGSVVRVPAAPVRRLLSAEHDAHRNVGVLRRRDDCQVPLQRGGRLAPLLLLGQSRAQVAPAVLAVRL
mmetsp:Transcript_39068/g.101307  ORF Transcript_39068/g.101307 Transcript_39068/m.101307 type:complete len:277 (+) Transcript_39068:918-1748(+)